MVSDLNNKTRTNEQGVAGFEWSFVGQSCDGNPCAASGESRLTTWAPTYFAPSQDNITHEITYKKAEALGSRWLGQPGQPHRFAIILMALLIAGAIYYQRVQQQRQVQALRGILTDAMMQLEASNEYIAAIFDCYKSLVKHFRKYGFMKKVYETAREFEAAVRTAFNMVPTDQLDDFLSIFEGSTLLRAHHRRNASRPCHADPRCHHQLLDDVPWAKSPLSSESRVSAFTTT